MSCLSQGSDRCLDGSRMESVEMELPEAFYRFMIKYLQFFKFRKNPVHAGWPLYVPGMQTCPYT